MTDPVKILGIAGSLRADSFNRAALRAAKALAPDGCRIDILELDPTLPGFNEEQEKSPPASVVEMKRRVREADAILFVTPEYNYSIPGVLKNAIDWASRPYGDNAWSGKPVAIMGASIGALGSSRAQYHLRQSLVFLTMPSVLQPEVMIANAAKQFDANGNLTNPDTKKLITQLLTALIDLTRKIR